MNPKHGPLAGRTALVTGTTRGSERVSRLRWPPAGRRSTSLVEAREGNAPYPSREQSRIRLRRYGAPAAIASESNATMLTTERLKRFLTKSARMGTDWIS